MGKIRTKTLGVEELEKQQADEAKKRREAKKLKKAEDESEVETKAKSEANSEAKEVKQVAYDEDSSQDAETGKRLPPQVRRKKVVGKKYTSAKKNVKANTEYSLEDAVALVKKMAYASFDESVELHLNVKDTGVKVEVALPHGTGKELNVVIADEALLKKLDNEEFDFDMLIATPAFMPQLVKYARVLGPKGLMPNPKNGTVTDKPEEAAKKFKTGSVQFKTEPKKPLMHQIVGKVSFKDEELIANIKALLAAVNADKIKEIYLSSTMSPSVKVSRS